MQPDVKSRGRLYLLLAALLFSTGGLLIKLVPWGPVAINGGRSLISSVILYIYMRASGHPPVMNRKVFFGSLCMLGTILCYVISNKLTTAANAIVLEYTAPVFIVIFMAAFFGKRPQKLDIVACGVVFVGILLFFIDGLSAGNMLGNIFGLMSGIAYAGVCLLKTMGCDSLSAIFFGHLWSAISGLPFILRESDFSAPALLGIAALGVFQLGIAYIFFNKGIQSTPAVEVSLICSIEPILNPVLVAIFFRETVGPLALVGVVIVIAGISAYSVLQARALRTQNAQSAQ